MVVGDLATSVDVVVLGAGPGGYVAALRAAQLGQQVALIDPGPPGGTCLNRGCIPSKALLTAAGRAWQTRTLADMGIHTGPATVDLARMQAWKDGVVARLVNGVRRLLQQRGVEIVTGRGWFMAENEVRVQGEYGAKRYAFESCVIAVGGAAAPLPGLPFDGRRVLTPAQALRLTTPPEQVTVAGADNIAVELATFFAKILGLADRPAGPPVRLLIPAGATLLSDFDPAAGRQVQARLKRLGVVVETDAANPAAAGDGSGGVVVVSNGLRPRTGDLALELVGVKTDGRGFIRVNDRQQTSNPVIYAAGDVTGGPRLATVAIKQAKVAAETLAGRAAQYAPQAVPKVVWTDPEVASVGLTAVEAEAAGYAVARGRFPLGASGRALTLAHPQGVALTVADAERGVLLGTTVIGVRAAELIGEAALALEMGATLTDLAETLHPHPGLGEALQESTAAALGSAVHL
ncbi:MAG: dihydrolipoyl dehydrogenase family protein, partial [Anaerolineae bacterium]